MNRWYHQRTKDEDYFRLAILKNANRIRNKVVLDVGAGTGILSHFCVEAGARKVYAVEASAIAEQAKKVALANNAQDKISVINDLVENIELPEKVDVIVSEWMGYSLLFEGMLKSVIYARDKWLKEDGIILPSCAEIYLAPISYDEDYEERHNFWYSIKDKYGVSMDTIVPLAKQEAFKNVCLCQLTTENVIAPETCIYSLSIKQVCEADLKRIEQPFSLIAMGRALVHGFTLWFNVSFEICDGSNVLLSTSPFSPPTHWCQSVMYLKDPFNVEQDQVIKGNIKIVESEESDRCIDIQMEFSSDFNGHSVNGSNIFYLNSNFT
ncbi:uncharacterized protein TRIADDRAFT_60467 [Trichoplax adhaerens]|uniref:Protein arginine N-methyltransferase 6 n=1 Tax=Trichoplax adhaerens TaxID=10228 RepID=B3S8A4_TRIAD|nr:hypothetical protein TRIADDRAFT_60467 [Trichoplax adhaerens]EDV21164.1 hypothetical protein TRIADDRAFT_60467 [Trichoplax adhaerens]|eukprot:XP_002116494.1 hypothetical protein TRIADDRAFT_60467 [Trichoplax adhaerens]